jgi:hypothetical protein
MSKIREDLSKEVIQLSSKLWNIIVDCPEITKEELEAMKHIDACMFDLALRLRSE